MPFDRNSHQGSRQRRHRIHPLSWAVAAALAPIAAGALPQDGLVKQGAATIQTPQTGLMLINQSTQTAAVDWRSFSVDKGETVNIVQPNSQALLINRVIGYDPTRILGQINANGRVVLSNPRGVYFSADSQVDVGSLVATTLGISDADLQSGVLRLGAASGGAGELRAEGRIRAADTVALVAPRLTVGGNIDARRVALAAASQVSVDVEGDGLVLFKVRNDDQLQTRLDALGTINASQSAELRAVARAGFADTVLNMEGMVRARSLEGVSGRVVIDGGSQGVTWVNGKIDASGGTGHAGGDVLVQGQRVMLDGHAQLDASGDTGGGRIRVGGDFHGANAEVRNAEMLVARPGATLTADAGVSGNGGQVVLWSDKSTRFYGSLSAKGGSLGGDGGSAEVSGRESLEFRGDADLRATKGATGSLLLDPDDITIATGGSAAGNLSFGTSGAVTVEAGTVPGGLGKLLQSTSVVLQAKNTITVSNTVDGSGGAGTGALTLQAGGDITINAAVTANGITLSANDLGGTQANGRVVTTADLTSTGGAAISITSNGSTNAHSLGGNITTNGTLTFNGNGTLTGAASAGTITIGSGTLTAGNGGTTGSINNGATVNGSGTLAFNRSNNQTVSANFTGSLAVAQAGSAILTLSGSNTYSGGTSVTSGTLKLGASNVLGSGAVTINGGTLDIANRNPTVAGVSLQSGSITGGTGALTSTSTFDMQAGTVSAQLAGSVGLTKTTNGSVTLSNTNNNYTGTTTISQGTLTLGASGTLPNAAVVVNGGTLDINTSTNTVSGVSLQTGSITGTTGVLTSTTDFDVRAGSASAILDGNVGLTKTTSGTATLSGANTYSGTTLISAGTLQIGAAGSTGTLGSGSVTDNAALVFNRSNALTVTNDISGSGTLAQAGTGTTTISGNNSYAGNTTISAGTLALGSATALPSGSGKGDLVVNGRLDLAGLSQAINGLSGSGVIDNSNASAVTLTVGANNGTGNFAGAIQNSSGALALTKSGTGTIVLSGTNTYAGLTTISAGTLQVGAAGSTGTLGSGSVTDNAALVFNRSNALTITNDISGSGSLEQAGTGTTTISGNNSYAGNTTISAGTLALGSATALPSGSGKGDLVVNGRLDLAGLSQAINGLSGSGVIDNSNASAVTLTVGANNGTGNFAGAIQNSSGALALTKSGTGTIVLSGTNTYAGLTTISAGTLQIGAAGSTGTLGSGSVSDNAALVFNRSDALTVANAISGSGSLEQAGSGTATISGNNSYAGNTTISAGTLALGSATALPSGSGKGDLVVNGRLDLAGLSQAINGLSGSGVIDNSNASAVTLTVGANNGTGNFAGAIQNSSGALALTKSGTGTIVLSGTNTYAGLTTISAGTLQIGAAGSTGTLGSGNVSDNAALVFNRSNALTVANAISGSGSLEQAGSGTTTLTGANSYGATTISAGTLQIGAAGSTGTLGSGSVSDNAALVFNRSDALTVANAISGAGSLAQAGTGTATISGNNSYAGNTTISAGTLALGSATALPSGSGKGDLVVNGRLDLAGLSQAINGLSGSGVIDNSNTSAVTLTVGANNGTGNFAGAIQNSSGALALTKSGTGTIVLSGTNTYAGLTTISAGTLQVGAAGSTGTLGSGNVSDNAALVFNRSNALTVANAISGSGSLEQAGSGTTTLTGANSYGATTISAGTLQIGAGGMTGSLGGGNVSNNATLVLDRSDALTVNNSISGSGTLEQAGSGTTTLGGTNSYGGGTTLAAGTLALGSAAALGSAGSIAFNGGTLQFSAGNTTDYSARFSNAASQAYNLDTNGQAVTLASALTSSGGSLTKSGAGTLTLTGANSYGGSTTISAGSLQIGAGGMTGSLGGGNVSNNATLVLDRSDALTVNNNISGSGTLEQAGSGTATLGGTNSYGGGTTLAAGTLALGSAAALGSAGSIAFNGGTLQFSAGNTTDYSARFSNAASQAYNLDTNGQAVTLASALTSSGGSLTKSGAGTLTLTGANSYGGSTSIASGGSLDVGNGGTTGSLGSGAVNNNGTLILDRSDASAVANNIGGSGNLVKQSAGTLTLSGSNSFSGGTSINAGQLTLGANGALGSGALAVNGGILDIATFTNTVSSLTVQSAIVNGTTGVLTAPIQALNNGAIVNASLGTGTLSSTGTVALNGASAATGVAVAGGTLTLGSAERLANTAAVTIANGATLKLNGNDTVSSLTTAGTLDKTGATDTLTALTGNYTLNTGAIINANLGTGTLTSQGNATLLGLSSATAVKVDSGTLSLGAADRFANAPAITVAGGATLKLNGGENIATGGLSLSGTLDVTTPGDTLVANTYTLHDSAVVNANLGIGTVNSDGATVTVNAPMAALSVNALSGRLSLVGMNLLASGATVNVSGGASLRLGGDATISQLNLSGQLNLPAQLEAASPSTLTATAGYALNYATTLAGANLGGQSALTAAGSSTINGSLGAPTLTVASHGTLVLAAPDNRLIGAPAITVNDHGTLTLQSNNTVTSISLGTGAIVNGSGSLNANSYVLDNATYNGNLTGGTLISRDNSVLNGQSSATSVTVETGTLTLGSAGRFTLLPNVVIDSGAVLKLNGSERVGTLTSAGTLAGTGTGDTLTAARYTLNDGAVVNANLGAGTLTSNGSVALNGTAAADLDIATGTLTLGAADRLTNTVAVTLASGATLKLNGNDSVGRLNSSGTLAKSGANDTLTATTYTLGDGTVVNANLGSGVLSSNGNVALNGTSAASAITIATGVLTLGAADRLTGGAAVTLASGATLKLNGNDAVASFTSAGLLDKTGATDTLTATSYALNDGAVVVANLGAGALTSTGAVALNGTASADIAVASGTLTLGTADRLASSAAVSVANGATLKLGGNDTVGTLTAAGTLAGTSAGDTLSAASYALNNGAAVNANLGAGTLTSNGAVALNGTAAATTVNVATGTLSLGAADRLADTAAVTVASGATLKLNGNGTVGTLAIAGTLDRTGAADTLSATTTTAGNGARLLASLGGGALATSGAVYISGNVGAQTLNVNGGTLQLDGGNQLGAAPATTLAAGATLALNGSQTLGSLAGAGAITAGAGTLAVGSRGDSQYDGVYSGAGSLRKEGAGTLVLTGNNGYTGSTQIAAGTLQVGADGSSGSLGSGAVDNAGLLRLQRSDAVTLNQAVSGSGSVEQAGTGTLTLATALQTSGVTKVSKGSLVTPGDERIANASNVVVDAGAQLQLGGNETLGSLTSAGNVELKGNLTSAGDVKISGTLGLTGSGPQSLSVSHLDAQNTGNALGGQPLSLSAQSVQLKTADSAALKLGTVSLAADSAIAAGTIELTGNVTLTGGTTSLVATAAPAAYGAEAGKQAANAQQLAVAGATISQTGGLIHAASGALALQAKGGGSITLLDGSANDLSGGISAVSGTAGAAWTANSSADQTVARQSRISLSGDALRVNGAGIDGDLVVIDAAKLSAATGSSIRARIPYSSALGFAVQLPGLTLKLRDAAFTQTYSFGAPGDGNALGIDVGSSASTTPAGFITILPKKPANLGATAIYANGPAVGTNGYQFFYDGARRSTEVPVVYNGVAPSTPEAQGSISATVAVSEGARKDRFDEAVRTENVAIRLRSGVIAEVGAGRPATIGKEGIRPPEGCTPTATLGCEP
ncbi:autotransporter-associated beta strand repeat-containing protein [Roseateles saccharophilus]|uniref:Autotransporter-associated beta strand protein n=3 Tax=Roseateles saccharophilus TaxID=304 RepID=A0A4R3UYZ8_ROSSA|nr:autotransporter-associated beta strand repeat-containing protein [Roseateles saccharophilus]TCU96311.1 autotransporter-associated beta strand protein [Roseateles saccharophilus]